MKMCIQSDVKEIDAIIQSISCLLKKPISRESYKIIDRGVPHKPESLPKGKIAVYLFKYNDEYLKIGRVGPNSSPRFQSQHYLLKSSISNLAKSISNDCTNYENMDSNHIGDWIKKNCQRIDILIDENLGSFASGLIESILHYRFRPKYEGKMK